MLSTADILKMFKWSRATLYRRIEESGFPTAHERRGSKSYWSAEEVKRWTLTQRFRGSTRADIEEWLALTEIEKGKLSPEFRAHIWGLWKLANEK